MIEARTKRTKLAPMVFDARGQSCYMSYVSSAEMAETYDTPIPKTKIEYGEPVYANDVPELHDLIRVHQAIVSLIEAVIAEHQIGKKRKKKA